MYNTLEKEKKFITIIQKQKEQNINIYQRSVDFEIKDKVYVSTKNWKTQ
jgi:hypothetical protein